MAAVMMPTEGLEYRKSEGREQERPRLALHEHTSKPLRTRSRARRQNLWETLFFAATVAAILVFCLVGTLQWLSRVSAASDQIPLVPVVTVPVTVHSGDTLWTYAQKYGASDTYILDRVETIARANHLTADAALTPGQHLRIPVTNPVILARIENRHRLARR